MLACGKTGVLASDVAVLFSDLHINKECVIITKLSK